MSATPTKSKKGIPASLLVLFGGFAMLGIMLMFSPDRVETPVENLPWNSKINAQGNIEALGLVTNQTTLIEAQRQFKDDIEIKLFSNKDESEKTAEAFLPSMHIGTIHAGLVLKLNVDQETLNNIYNRGVKTTVNQGGSREISPSQQDDLLLKGKTFSVVTLVPRKNLSKEALEKRFGKPDKVETQDDGLDHWFYPAKGLEILFDPEGPEALQYYKF